MRTPNFGKYFCFGLKSTVADYIAGHNELLKKMRRCLRITELNFQLQQSCDALHLRYPMSRFA